MVANDHILIKFYTSGEKSVTSKIKLFTGSYFISSQSVAIIIFLLSSRSLLLNSNADKFHLSWGHESFVKNLLPDFQRIGQHPNIAACSKWHHASCCSAAIYRTSGKDRFYSPVSFEEGIGIATVVGIYEKSPKCSRYF